MKHLTPTENLVLLTLFKDFSTNYNANSISKVLKITPRGALKILKNLYSKGILISKKFGKAVFYKVNLKDDYTFRLTETLLMYQSREEGRRWLFEFRDFYPEVEIVLIFGSVIRNGEKANDIEVVFVFRKKKYKMLRKLIDDKNRILLKPIHPIFQTPEDLKKNLAKKDPVILNAIKMGYVLCGYDKLIGAVQNVTCF